MRSAAAFYAYCKPVALRGGRVQIKPRDVLHAYHSGSPVSYPTS